MLVARHKIIFMLMYMFLGARILAIICVFSIYMGGEWVMMWPGQAAKKQKKQAHTDFLGKHFSFQSDLLVFCNCNKAWM